MYLNQSSLTTNAILGALPEDSRDAIMPHLELVKIGSSPLACVGEPSRHLYFPTTAVMSVLRMMDDGAMIEVASVGREGVLGWSILGGSDAISTRFNTRVGGVAYRLPITVMQAESERSLETYRLLLNYCQAMMAQISRSALCNRHHSVSEQLSRWLLLTHDRIDGDELVVTHQNVANTLGVRREGVTQAMGTLQETGVIRQSRGCITVLDRDGLEHCACECYDLICGEYSHMLGMQPGRSAMPRLWAPQTFSAYGA
ncbi:Crp/Fnr family transcriptional regulator [Burkholderia seminalis]|uniref:Crp/Fnr family transcriptional regulator n=1 Tax=Burkholderia seminalis TaxID=488731 RepID=UPI0014538058|nr:Crp/Fnr family transcriptional regulator [Burkholderia seminalis]MCA8435384.1 Crp/Fnr family transcriptional regulator [Burkholderia seminalis]VWC32861.1 Crp/Fnr family transcriptional regulator [Burkholderia seminalis]